jgi:hypothetical protein
MSGSDLIAGYLLSGYSRPVILLYSF